MIPVIVLCLALAGCSHPIEDGLESMKSGQYEEALGKFEDAIEAGKRKKTEKNLAEAYRGQGLALWELGRYEEAKQAFQEALDSGADKTGTLYNLLAGCEMKTGAYSDALNHYHLALSQEGNGTELVQEIEFNMIAAYEKLYDWESAKEKLKAYIEKYPDDIEAAKEWGFLQSR